MGGERQPAGLCCSACCFSGGRSCRRVAAAGDGEGAGSASPQGFAVQPAASAAGASAEGYDRLTLSSVRSVIPIPCAVLCPVPQKVA